MDVSKRETIPERYVWRMTDIYADDEQWEQDFARVRQMTEEMAAFAGHLQEEGQLETALLLYEQLNRTLEQVYMYAHMQQDLDNASAKYQSMNDRAQSLLFGMQEALAFFLPELTAMDPQALRSRVAADPRLASFDHMIDDIIRSRKYVLPQREEQLVWGGSRWMSGAELMRIRFSLYQQMNTKAPYIADYYHVNYRVRHMPARPDRDACREVHYYYTHKPTADCVGRGYPREVASEPVLLGRNGFLCGSKPKLAVQLLAQEEDDEEQQHTYEVNYLGALRVPDDGSLRLRELLATG